MLVENSIEKAVIQLADDSSCKVSAEEKADEVDSVISL